MMTSEEHFERNPIDERTIGAFAQSLLLGMRNPAGAKTPLPSRKTLPGQRATHAQDEGDDRISFSKGQRRMTRLEKAAFWQKDPRCPGK